MKKKKKEKEKEKEKEKGDGFQCKYSEDLRPPFFFII
jgi:hypothetical protein